MKLLLVAPHYPPTYVGGVELYVQRLARYCSARGVECRVVAIERLWNAGSRFAAVDKEEHGVMVSRLDVPRPEEPERFRATYCDARVADWLTELVRAHRFDVIHLHSGYLNGGAVLAAARACRVPVVVTLHDYWFICPRITLLHPDGSICSGPETADKCALCLMTERRRIRWLAALGGSATPHMLQTACAVVWPGRVKEIEDRRRELVNGLLSAARILSPSRFLIEQMVLAGFPRHRIELVTFGVPARERVPAPPRTGRRLKVGFLGQVAPHKGVHVAIQAVRWVNAGQVELIIRGHLDRAGQYVRHLRRLASDDPRIVFGGPIDHRELDGFFASIDLLVVPSVWYENSPFVIHEARTAGVPVLASDLGGMAELVRHDVDGLLARPGDAASFAEQLHRAATDPALLPRLRANVRQPPTQEEEFEALLASYRSLCRPATV